MKLLWVICLSVCCLSAFAKEKTYQVIGQCGATGKIVEGEITVIDDIVFKISDRCEPGVLHFYHNIQGDISYIIKFDQHIYESITPSNIQGKFRIAGSKCEMTSLNDINYFKIIIPQNRSVREKQTGYELKVVFNSRAQEDKLFPYLSNELTLVSSTESCNFRIVE